MNFSTSTTLEQIAKFNELLIQLDLVNKVAEHNLGYLSISVAIILAASILIGVLTYFFGFKPVIHDIKQYEQKLAQISKEFESKFIGMSEELRNDTATELESINADVNKTKSEIIDLKKEILDKINHSEIALKELKQEAQKDLRTLKRKYQENELDALWNSSYMWEGRGVHVNEFADLIDYMKLAIEYDRTYAEHVWIERIRECVEKIDITNNREYEMQLLEVLDLMKKSPKIHVSVIENLNDIIAKEKSKIDPKQQTLK